MKSIKQNNRKLSKSQGTQNLFRDITKAGDLNLEELTGEEETGRDILYFLIPLLTFLGVYLGVGIIFLIMGTKNPFKKISREFAAVW